MSFDASLLGIGLYSLPEAARLTDVSVSRLRRWLLGYRFRASGEAGWSPPLWTARVPEIQGQIHVGVRDLAEIRIVESLVRAGVSLPTVRRAVERARLYVQDQRPFSTTKFKTD